MQNSFLTYLVKQFIEGAIAHVFCDYAEELWLIAYPKNLDYVVKPGFVKDLSFFQQTISLPVRNSKHYERVYKEYVWQTGYTNVYCAQKNNRTVSLFVSI